MNAQNYNFTLNCKDDILVTRKWQLRLENQVCQSFWILIPCKEKLQSWVSERIALISCRVSRALQIESRYLFCLSLQVIQAYKQSVVILYLPYNDTPILISADHLVSIWCYSNRRHRRGMPIHYITIFTQNIIPEIHIPHQIYPLSIIFHIYCIQLLLSFSSLPSSKLNSLISPLSSLTATCYYPMLIALSSPSQVAWMMRYGLNWAKSQKVSLRSSLPPQEISTLRGAWQARPTIGGTDDQSEV